MSSIFLQFFRKNIQHFLKYSVYCLVCMQFYASTPIFCVYLHSPATIIHFLYICCYQILIICEHHWIIYSLHSFICAINLGYHNKDFYFTLCIFVVLSVKSVTPRACLKDLKPPLCKGWWTACGGRVEKTERFFALLRMTWMKVQNDKMLFTLKFVMLNAVKHLFV